MKKILLILILCNLLFVHVNAQSNVKLDDFGRIVLNAYVSEESKLPIEAKEHLLIKLKQIATNYGMAGSSANDRFILTANVTVGTKDIIPGPPQMLAQNIEITFFIGDAIENRIFTNRVISSKGVGNNENKAFIDAIKKLNVNNSQLSAFIEQGKNEIVAYYHTQCDFILQEAESQSQQGDYDKAIYTLLQVPQVCVSCYEKCMAKLPELYNRKINTEADYALSQAKAIWSANSNEHGAGQANSYLTKIHPEANASKEAIALQNTITRKIIASENDRKRREEELQKQRAALEKERINAYREVAVEYARSRPRIIYRNIYWY